MNRGKLSVKAIMLVTGIGLAAAGLGGSQPAVAQSYSDDYSCPAGFIYDPTYGCTLSDAYQPYDYGYSPYYGGDGSYYGRRFDSGHGFAHGMGGGFTHDLGGSINHGAGFGHGGGFGHAMGAGFGHAMGGGHGGGGGHRQSSPQLDLLPRPSLPA